MDILELVVKLIDAVVWPALVAWVAFLFQSEIRGLVNRVVHDSEEINVFGVSAKFTDAKNELSSLDIGDTEKNKLVEILDDLALSEIRQLAKNFYSKGLTQRIATAKEVAAIGLSIDLSKLLELAKSELAGDRVAAAIAIQRHIERDYSVLENEELLHAIKAGLNDDRSRVRYRYAELTSGNSILAKKHEEDLRVMAKNDDNEGVRKIISRYLGYN